MRRVLGLGLTTMLVLGVTPAEAQRPDLSGTWAAVAGTDPSTGRPLPQVYGAQFSITHADPSLTLIRTFAGSPATIKYVLDGSEVTSRMPGRLCEPDSGATWTGAWDANAVVLTMVGATPANGKVVKMNVRSTLKLESPDKLLVEVSAQAAGQAAPRVTTTTYTRSGPPPAPPAVSAPKTTAKMSQVEWIAGVWTGTRGTSNIEERWTPSTGGAMLAISRTTRDGLMSAFEFLCIVERDGGLVYQAMPNGRSPATDFTLTKIDETSATFENPTHDFPKMIRYAKLEDGSLEATISGGAGSKPVSFLFKKQ